MQQLNRVKKIIKFFSITLILLGQIGCAYCPNEQTKMIREDNIKYMKHCTLVGQVYGTSDFAYLAMGVEMAKDRAKAQAAEIGATHVCWTEISSVGLPYAVGKAYFCKQESH